MPVIQIYPDDQLLTDINKLALEIDKLKLSNLVLCGIPRGGLVPAVMISHRLATEHHFVNLSNCDMAKYESVHANLVVCDEILDTSATFERTLQWLSNWDWNQIYFITIHAKEHHAMQPLKWKLFKKAHVIAAHTAINAEQFVVYPWEKF